MRKIAVILVLVFMVGSVTFGQENGNATYYSSRLKGRKTTDGSKYHPDSLTCAHKTYPLGTILKVRNPANNQEVIVKVTDRGPFAKKMMIDLSYSAARSLDILRKGVANVEITKLNILPDGISLIPDGMSILPTPKAYLNVDQFVVVKNYLKKIFVDDSAKESTTANNSTNANERNQNKNQNKTTTTRQAANAAPAVVKVKK